MIPAKTYDTVPPQRIAYIGLGTMGAPMAAHLVRAGHQVTVYNRTRAKAEAFVSEHGGALAHTPAEAAKDAQLVITCVGNDDDLRAVTIGPDGAFHGMKPGAIFVDHTTASAAVARELHAAGQQRGLHFVDAPVSGGQGGAAGGGSSSKTSSSCRPSSRARNSSRSSTIASPTPGVR